MLSSFYKSIGGLDNLDHLKESDLHKIKDSWIVNFSKNDFSDKLISFSILKVISSERINRYNALCKLKLTDLLSKEMINLNLSIDEMRYFKIIKDPLLIQKDILEEIDSKLRFI